jgi:hypothetical protein
MYVCFSLFGCLSFIMPLSMEDLLCRKVAFAETSCESCCAHGHDKGLSTLAHMTDLILNTNKVLVTNYCYLFIIAYW